MGRHAAATPVDARRKQATDDLLPVGPVTDPRLFDAPAGRSDAPAPAQPHPSPTSGFVPDQPVAATPRIANAFAEAHPRPVAPIVARRTPQILPPTLVAPALLALSATTAPVPARRPSMDLALRDEADASGSLESFGRRGRGGVKVAVCAIALLGAVSGAAVLLPSDTGAANAATRGKAVAGTASALTCTPTGTSRRTPMPGRTATSKRTHSQGFIATLFAALSGDAASTPRPSAAGDQSSGTASPTATTTTGSSTPSETPSPTSSTTSAPPVLAVPVDPTPSATPTATSTPVVTGGGNLRTLAAAHPGSLTLGRGVYSFPNFLAVPNSDNFLGVDTTGNLIGAGEDSTILEMQANSSTHAANVPTASGTTNQLSLIRVTNAHVIRDFTLQGTDQGHLYNGLRIIQSTNAQVSNVRVNAVPGNNDNPPGETFGINDGRTDGSHYSNVEIDGKGVSGADFASNTSQNVTIENSYFHDAGHSHGATFWQTHNVTVRNTVSNNNYDTGFNFERVTGVVTLSHDTTKGNRLADIRVGSDQGSAVYNIIDPVFSGPKLRIMLTPTYFGVKNLQRKSDIHVIVDGKDRTNDLVEWVTHF